MRQRLAESFEAALRLADGRALVMDMDSNETTLFSSKFACPVCNYALAELEPRLFSFNSPMGACPSCDGLGQATAMDPARVVAHPELSVRRQCELLGVTRSTLYYEPAGETDENLALMRLIDEQFQFAANFLASEIMGDGFGRRRQPIVDDVQSVVPTTQWSGKIASEQEMVLPDDETQNVHRHG